MANDGLYIHNGSSFVRQNSGVCKRQGSGAECEIYAYNSSGSAFKIYPREISYTINPSASGGIALDTATEVNWWREDKAMQGYYSSSGSYTTTGENIGMIYWRNGKPKPPGTIVDVTNVQFSIKRNVNTGWYNNRITGYLGLSNITNSGSFASAKSYVKSHARWSFDWNVGGTTTTISNNSGLNSLIKTFLTTSSAKALCLYSGETSGINYNGEWMSRNYAGSSSISIKIWLTYEA